MSDPHDPRFAPPVAHVADLAPDGPTLARRGTRLLAAIVDALIVGGLAWALMMIPAFQPLVLAQGQATAQSAWSFTPFSLVLGAVVFLAVQAWPLLTRAQTLGKIVFKLRIERSDGSKPDAFRLLGLRYGIGILMNANPMLSMVYGLVDALLIFRGSRQCLHDTIADTRVVQL